MQAVHGSGGKGDDAPAYYRQPDTIRSTGTVRALCVLSAGPVFGLANGNQSLLLDGTPYADSTGNVNVEGITWQVTTGGADQTPLNHHAFNSVERAEAVGQTLLHNQPVTRTGRAEAARLTIRFPTGLLQQTDAGIFLAGVRIRIETKLASGGAWQAVKTDAINEKQSSLFEKQYLIPAPSTTGNSDTAPRFSIRVTRLTEARDDSNVRDRVDWGVVTWITHDRLSYAGLSLLAITASAEGMSGRLPRLAVEMKGRLVRVPSNYNPDTRAYNGIWDGQFVMRWSNNPAWVLYDVLVDRHWGLGIRADAIDRYDFYDLARYADELVDNGGGGSEPRFLFDAVLRRRESAAALVGRICAAVRAVVFWSGGQLRCIVDKPRDAVLRLTNAHVEDGRFVYSTATRQAGFSHAVVSFADPDSPNGVGVEAETSPALLARHGFRQHEVQLLGCQRRSQARRHARWLLETAAAGLHSISWRASIDHFADSPIRPGDVVAIYDAHRFARTAIPFRISLKNGAMWVMRPIASHFADDASLKLRYETATGWAEVPITATDMATTGTTGITRSKILPQPARGSGWPTPPLAAGVALVWNSNDSPTATSAPLYRVVGLREIDRARVEVDAVLHDASKYSRIDSAAASIGTRQGKSLDFSTPLPIASGLVASQLKFGSGRDIQLSWTPPLDARIAEWQLEAKGPESETRTWRVSAPPAVMIAANAGGWQFAVRAVDWTGRRGKAANLSHTVAADAITPTPPTGVSIIAGYGQLALTWTRPAATANAEVEVWEYPNATSNVGEKIASIQADSWIALGRPAGTTAYFRVRTRLAGGTVSAFSNRVSAAALALPADGSDGKRGSIIASKQSSHGTWRDSDAVAAIALLVSGGAVAGDLVTLWQATPSVWSETRRYDGSAWQVVDAVLSGKQIAQQSIPASRLLIDSNSLTSDSDSGALKVGSLAASHITSGTLQSSNYAADEAGFSIDMTGKAEFNDATIRGVLLGGRIEGTTLVSSIDTTPTEAGKPYVTHSVPRRLTYKTRLHDRDTHKLTIGPLIVSPDAASRRLNDARNVVLAYNDPHGAVAGEAINANFSRFWAESPKFALTLDMTRSGSPWGQNVTTGQLQVRLETESGRKLAECDVIDLGRNRTWQNASRNTTRRHILRSLDGFATGSYVAVSRSVTQEASGQRRTFTSGISIRMEMGTIFSYQSDTTTGEGLQMKILANFATTGLTIDVTNSFYHSIKIEGATID